MRKLTAFTSPVAVAALFLSGAAFPAHAGPYWNKHIKCEATDPDGRRIPTRLGNGVLGWTHFSGKHNIKKCALVTIPLRDKVDKVDGHNLLYWGWASDRAHGRVKIIVKARYARRTDDRRYDAGERQVIGVITAYCKGMRKCPNWVNG
ncbi:hypothetical protein [Streptomyces rubradiris]|uniref:Uncharacterized protein n=1 Tax=Streptomyces rubradiris TaxID=285531 RepID=A0ABQ3RDW6_STRRR|nr:hypothetical protein [Streptomyces rubradiris]GHH28285.1 hypothetical protein GCM10018792_71750 [Streptomyces rubradiris]GHI54049.1 hypothetical protein Srubr_38950 [Streptomyces rubradiris]